MADDGRNSLALRRSWQSAIGRRAAASATGGGDLIQFRKEFGATNLTSPVERVSRFTVLLKNADCQSRLVMDGVIGSLAPLPAHACRSITFDRGLEFLAWPYLQAGPGVATW